MPFSQLLPTLLSKALLLFSLCPSLLYQACSQDSLNTQNLALNFVILCLPSDHKLPLGRYHVPLLICIHTVLGPLDCQVGELTGVLGLGVSALVKETIIITIKWDVTVRTVSVFLLQHPLCIPCLPRLLLFLPTSTLKKLFPSSNPWVGIITKQGKPRRN